jgi:hypothetical protein
VAVAADLAPPAIGATEVALVFGLLFTILAISILDSIRGPVVGIAGGVPLVGSGLGPALDSALGALRERMYSALSAQLQAFAAVLGWLQTLWTQLSATLAGFGSLTATAATRITTVILPAQLGLGLGLVSGWVAAARADALALVASERALAGAATLAVEQEVQSLQAVALTASALAGLETSSAAAALIAGAQAEARGLFVTAEADIQTLRDSAAAAVAVAELDIANASAGAAAALEGRIEGIAVQLGADIQAGVSALEREIALAQSQSLAFAVGAAAAVAVDVAAIRALKCIQNCAPLGDLGQFLTALDIGLLIAFVVEARAHPEAANEFMRAEVAPFLKSAAGGVEALIGV